MQGYLTHAANAFVEDIHAPSPLSEAAETVSELLISASGDFSPQNEETIRNLVEKFISGLSSSDGVDAERRQMPFTAKKLDQAINVGSQRNMSSTLGLTGNTVDLESANARKVESKVDRKKLEKAERKIRAKQEKKQMKTVQYESSRLITQPDDSMSYEEFFMAVNPLQLGSDSQSKSKDIRVDNIDVAVGGHRILSDASLTLAYGHRYGLVGQNGIGKSTLLRALSRREVAVPSHISILHVDQEVLSLCLCASVGINNILTLFSRLQVMIPKHFKQFWTPTCGGNTSSSSKMLVSFSVICCDLS